MEHLYKHIPKEFHNIFTAIVELTDKFCEQYLNDDYQQLARDMAIKVCRKGPVDIRRGKAKGWASGIIHALGWVNFLHDPATKPYMNSSDVAKGFGVSTGTMTTKSKIIRDALHIIPLDPNWCLPELLEDNPLVWMIERNGLIMDIRNAPREVQEAAYAKGMIPYIPADKKRVSNETGSEVPNIEFSKTQNNKVLQKKKTKPDNDRTPSLF